MPATDAQSPSPPLSLLKRVGLALRGFGLLKPTHARLLTSPDPVAVNPPGHSDRVQVQDVLSPTVMELWG